MGRLWPCWRTISRNSRSRTRAAPRTPRRRIREWARRRIEGMRWNAFCEWRDDERVCMNRRERMTQKKRKNDKTKKCFFLPVFYEREPMFWCHHHHHHHHDVAMAHSVWFWNQWIFRFSHFKALCRREKRKKKNKKIVYFFDFIDLNPLYHIVGLNPFGLISDCVLSVAAPFCFCCLNAVYFSVHWTVCRLWICGLLRWGFGRNGRLWMCIGGMDGVDLVNANIHRLPCMEWIVWRFYPSEWLICATKNK